MQIQTLRKKINEIDIEIITLLANRLSIVNEIGKIKKEKGIKPLDLNRWDEITKRRKLLAKELNIDEYFIERIYKLIHAKSLEIEK